MLIDASRLVWRWWRGGLPTGVDRVCLAYLKHFRAGARAVIQRGGRYFVLDPVTSQRLFDLFEESPENFRGRFTAIASKMLLRAASSVPRRGEVYLNIGHTGLNEPSLPGWIARHDLRAVYFVHDLIPITHPEYCRAGEREKHVRRMNNVLASAAGVIGNSQTTIEELAAFAVERRLPMPMSVAAPIAGPAAPASVTPLVLDRPHFITVGTIEGRKNHALLLRVWQRLVRRLGPKAPLLLIVGQRGWEAGEAFALLDRTESLKDHVRELGHCGDKELAGYIAGARALLMPSFTEGFGLPVAEALELGTPVIASNLQVFREFAREVPTYLDPIDGIAWERTISEFVGDCPERSRQARAISSYSAPDWRGHFETVDRWLGALDEQSRIETTASSSSKLQMPHEWPQARGQRRSLQAQ